MKVAVALDFSGVLAIGTKAIPRARDALMLLKKHSIPYVVLTNAGGRTDKDRASIMSSILSEGRNAEPSFFTEDNVIQAHSPMKMLYENVV